MAMQGPVHPGLGLGGQPIGGQTPNPNRGRWQPPPGGIGQNAPQVGSPGPAQVPGTSGVPAQGGAPFAGGGNPVGSDISGVAAYRPNQAQLDQLRAQFPGLSKPGAAPAGGAQGGARFGGTAFPVQSQVLHRLTGDTGTTQGGPMGNPNATMQPVNPMHQAGNYASDLAGRFGQMRLQPGANNSLDFSGAFNAQRPYTRAMQTLGGWAPTQAEAMGGKVQQLPPGASLGSAQRPAPVDMSGFQKPAADMSGFQGGNYAAGADRQAARQAYRQDQNQAARQAYRQDQRQQQRAASQFGQVPGQAAGGAGK